MRVIELTIHVYLRPQHRVEAVVIRDVDVWTYRGVNGVQLEGNRVGGIGIIVFQHDTALAGGQRSFYLLLSQLLLVIRDGNIQYAYRKLQQKQDRKAGQRDPGEDRTIYPTESGQKQNGGQKQQKHRCTEVPRNKVCSECVGQVSRERAEEKKPGDNKHPLLYTIRDCQSKQHRPDQKRPEQIVSSSLKHKSEIVPDDRNRRSPGSPGSCRGGHKKHIPRDRGDDPEEGKQTKTPGFHPLENQETDCEKQKNQRGVFRPRAEYESKEDANYIRERKTMGI